MNGLEKAEKILAGICLECNSPTTDHLATCSENFKEMLSLLEKLNYTNSKYLIVGEDTAEKLKNGGWFDKDDD